MKKALNFINTHVVDILGNTKGRDQPIMKMDKAVELVKCLDREVLKSDDYVFFDPFCKAGEILLATALVRNLYNSEKGLVSVDQIYKDLYKSNRYFALAPDERHHRLTLRTFLGNEKSHGNSFTQNIKNGDYLSEEDGRLNKEKFEQELKAMLEYIKEKVGNKKVIAVGNPPYQEQYKGDVAGASNIFQIFLEQLIDVKKNCHILLVIPARWYSGGRGLDSFRKKVFNSGKIKLIKDFETSEDIFPTVQIKGGVCFFLYSNEHKGHTNFIKGNESSQISLRGRDFFIRDIHAHSIVEKINKKTKLFMDSIVWSWEPFGLNSNYFDKNKEDNESKNTIKCFTKDRSQRIKIISRNKIKKNAKKINEYKVVCPKAIKTGGVPPSRDQFFILKKEEICTATYNVIGSFETKKDAENLLSYVRTDFVRFLISLLKITHDMIVKTWQCVPAMNVSEKWTDEKLFEYFKLNKEEEKYIRAKAKNWG